MSSIMRALNHWGTQTPKAVKKEPQTAEILEQICRIAESKRFRDSDAIRKMLLQLGKHAAEHPGEALKEYHLAVESLGRSDDFDPKVDASVRVVAGRLRSKLAEYYTHEGSKDPILVDLPKGSYALSCNYGPQFETLNCELGDPVISRPAARRKLVWAALFLLAFLAGSVPAYLVGRGSKSLTIAKPVRLFWSSLLVRDQSLIIFSNPAFRRSADGTLRLHDPLALRSEDSVSVYTGIGEIMAVCELVKNLTLLGYDPGVKRAQIFTWDEALNNDLILLGGPEQSSATAQLPRLEKFILEPSFSGSQASVKNAVPAPGEEASYLPSKDIDNGIEYAVVALMPGASSLHRVLILAGTNTYGTQAAAMAVCDPDLLRGLFERLSWHTGAPIPPFEALLQVRVRGGTPLQPELLMVHKRSH